MSKVLRFPSAQERAERARARDPEWEPNQVLNAEALVEERALDLLDWAEAGADLAGMPPEVLELLDAVARLREAYAPLGEG